MGYASVGPAIFDPIAKALIEEEASPDLKRRVLGDLLAHLLGEDWDTAWDSLQHFRDDLVTRSVFYQHDVGARFSEHHPEGELGYNDETGLWTLHCTTCDVRNPIMLADFTAVGHDHLVRHWPEHLADKHGVHAAVDEWRLINQPADTSN